LREPEIAVGTERNVVRFTGGGRNGVLGNLTQRGRAPHGVGSGEREPEIAVGPLDDPARSIAGRNVELGDRACARDLAELGDVLQREPKLAAGPWRDPGRIARRRRDRILADLTAGRDAPDLVGRRGSLREPEVAVRARGDGERTAVGRRDIEALELRAWRDARDAIVELLGEPEIAVGAQRDARGV